MCVPPNHWVEISRFGSWKLWLFILIDDISEQQAVHHLFYRCTARYWPMFGKIEYWLLLPHNIKTLLYYRRTLLQSANKLILSQSTIMGGKGGCSLCRLINMLVSLAFLGAGGYMIWYFLGQPDADDIQGYWENFDGFGDFGDVLGWVLDVVVRRSQSL